jgi:hypothetical protein
MSTTYTSIERYELHDHGSYPKEMSIYYGYLMHAYLPVILVVMMIDPSLMVDIHTHKPNPHTLAYNHSSTLYTLPDQL